MSDIIKDVEKKMGLVVDYVCEEFVVICIGCVNFVMFNKFMVEYYGIFILL